MIEKLIRLANYLDSSGLVREADLIDILLKLAEDDEMGQLIELPGAKAERERLETLEQYRQQQIEELREMYRETDETRYEPNVGAAYKELERLQNATPEELEEMMREDENLTMALREMAGPAPSPTGKSEYVIELGLKNNQELWDLVRGMYEKLMTEEIREEMESHYGHQSEWGNPHQPPGVEDSIEFGAEEGFLTADDLRKLTPLEWKLFKLHYGDDLLEKIMDYWEVEDFKKEMDERKVFQLF